MKHVKIFNVELQRASRAWICSVHFSVTTHRQFTNEHHTVTADGNSMIAALLKGLLAVRSTRSHLRAIHGEFNIA